MNQVQTLNTVGWRTASIGLAGLLAMDSTLARMGSFSSSSAVADLGSDPNSALYACLYEQHHPELGSDPNSAALSPRAVARRIGVKAQFGDAPVTKPTLWCRIGIRPQICYRRRATDTQINSTLTPIIRGISA